MSTIRVFEILAQSEKSCEDAAQVAFNEATKAIPNINSINVQEMQPIITKNGKKEYRVNAQVFYLEKS